MSSKRPASALGEGWEDLVRRQLERILAGTTFQQVDRLRRFLSFVVLECIAGRRDSLKEYVVGIQVFGKEPSFDPRTDPVVRVQARRLRARLVRYYAEEGGSDDIVIELPKGGYAPVFTRRQDAAPRPSLGTTVVNRNTACVLPFADHSAGGDLGYFCKGVREEIIHQLSSLRNLRVLGRDTVDDDTRGERSRAPEAAVIITGSVRTAGDRVRVTAQFLDGVSGCYLWSSSVDGQKTDVFETQERVAATVTRKLASDLVELPTMGRRWPGTVNLAAYNLYLQGRYHLNQRTEEGLLKAVDFFEKALAEDAEYGIAHAGLSDAYALLAHYGVLRPADVWTKAAATAASAVMLDSDSAEAYTSLAHAKATQDWDWQGAEQDFRRAIALDPRYATASHWYSMTVLVPTGRLDEALERMLVAKSLDPVSAIIARDVAMVYYYRREFESALEQCDSALELNPHFPPAYLTLAFVQEQLNELDESEAALERAVHLAPKSPRSLGALARFCALADRRRQAFKLLHDMEALANDRYVAPFEFATVHFCLGQVEESREWFSRAIDDRNFEWLAVRVDPRWEPLLEHLEIAPIIARVGTVAPHGRSARGLTTQ